MNFEGVVMNVTDLNRSIDFYRQVLGFTLLTQNDQLATVSAPDSDQPQVIVFRAFGSGRCGRSAPHRSPSLRIGGRVNRSTGADRRRAEFPRTSVSRRDHSDWTAVVGRDPDGVAVVLACVSDEGRITETSWRTLDDLLYGIGE